MTGAFASTADNLNKVTCQCWTYICDGTVIKRRNGVFPGRKPLGGCRHAEPRVTKTHKTDSSLERTKHLNTNNTTEDLYTMTADYRMTGAAFKRKPGSRIIYIKFKLSI